MCHVQLVQWDVGYALSTPNKYSMTQGHSSHLAKLAAVWQKLNNISEVLTASTVTVTATETSVNL
jgi:hypothetical protein